MKKITFLLVVWITVFSCQTAFAQNNQAFKMSGTDPEVIELNQTISSSIEIFPFGDKIKKVFGLALDAGFTLDNDKSYIRVILLDENYQEHLVYEIHSLLEPAMAGSVEELCEETSVLNSVKPRSLLIELSDASLTLNKLTYANSMQGGNDIPKLKKEKKQAQNTEKIKKINKALEAKGKHWLAGPTSVSELTYSERKSLYGQSNFPPGFEYYSGGVIQLGSNMKSAAASSPYVNEFDWRNRHGKNWITSVKNQGSCGSCWAFAATGATEALANLYFNNENLDLNLSEQEVLSCTGTGNDCDGGLPYLALDLIKNSGISDEANFTYTASDLPCANKGTNPAELIKISGRIGLGTTEFPRTEDDMKRMIINKGPLSGGIYDWSHAMVLVGYKVVEEGDYFLYSDGTTLYDKGWVTIGSGDPLIGKTVWIFKNSWGSWGDGGYSYFEVDMSNFGWTHALQTPVQSEIVSRSVTYEDADGDGYYWWGLGDKPAACPGPDLADGDDSDPTKGPLDEYGYCMVLGEQTDEAIGGFNVYYGHLHNHSNVSDGTGTVDYAYDYARNTAGLDFFGLSDHANQIDAAEWSNTISTANSYNVDGEFTTFWGFEWSHNTLGHVTVINTNDYCTRTSVPTFQGLLDWVNTRECAAFFNHPGRQDAGAEFGHFADTPSDKFVGMELWNKADLFDVYYYNDGYYSNDGNLGYFEEALVRDWKIGAGGSEDNHTGDWGTRTDNRMAVLANNLTRADIYDAIQNKRFFSTLDNNIMMSFKINGSEMGSTIEGNSGQTLEILASDGDGELFTVVELFKNGILENTWNPGVTDVSISEQLTTSDGDYYYVKVTQPDGDEAISSPVYIEGGIVNVSPECIVTNPVDGTHYSATQTISLSADATDSDGTITSVEFFVDGSSVGVDATSPYSVSWVIPANGAYSITAKATDNLGSTTVSDGVNITVGNYTESLAVRIATGSDDVEEGADGTMYSTSTDLELIYDTYSDQFEQTVGLRFNNLGIPQGATINSASIEFTVDEVSTGTCNLVLHGHDSDNSEGFSSGSFDVSSRSTTTASVNWSPADWSNAGDLHSTPDISSIIQEIVSRSGFKVTSSVSIIITGSGTVKRTAEAYEGVPSSAALLRVEYTFGNDNNPPVFLSDPVVENTATEDVAYTGSIADNANDADDDPMTFSKVSGPDWLSVTSDGALSGTPANGDVGTNIWTIRVEDGNDGFDQAQLQIAVTNTNDPPVFTSDPIVKSEASEGQAYSGTISGNVTDPDVGDELTFSKVSGPTWLTIATDGALSGTPSETDIGASSWVVKVDDGEGGTDQADLQITVINTNDPPVFTTDPIAMSDATEDEAYSGTISGSATDPDVGDELTYSKDSGPDWLFVGDDGALSGTPANSDVGANVWTVLVSDGNGGSDLADLQIDVINTNDSPVFTTDPIIESDATEGFAYSGSISGSATDPDVGDDLTYSKFSGPSWLSVASDGTLSGTPSSGDIGPNSWTVEVDDGDGSYDQATLEIEVLEFSLEYCTSSGDAGYEFIAGVRLDGNENISSYDGVGYHDYTGATLANLEAGQSYQITLTPYWDGRSKFEYWGVWIDFNVDGDFEDAGERVFTGGKSKAPVSGTVAIPSGLSVETRMRVSMARSTVVSPCGSVGLGEVEDYLVVIGNPNPQPPVVDFEADLTQIYEGETIQFTDLSTNGPTSWSWSFGDGGTSTSQNPSHMYLVADTYSVGLVATNAVGSDELIKSLYITVLEPNEDPPIADFSANPTTVTEGGTVQFTDESSNEPTSWYWTFGDGGTSTLQNPSHIYTTATTYSVSLTATNGFGSNTYTWDDCITVEEQIVEPYCESASTSNALEWISNVEVSDLSNPSSAGLYSDFTGMTANLNPGSSYSITVSPGFSNKSQREFFRVWIDFNQNGLFTDLGETVLIANNKKAVVTASFTVPEGLIGTTRMRVTMKNGSAPNSCETFGGGEVEDYTVDFGGAGKSGLSGFADLVAQKSLTVYPNPSSDYLFIKTDDWEGKKNLRLMDMTGRTLFEQEYTGNMTEIDLSDYPKGIYMVEVNDGYIRKNRKISKL